MVQRKTHAPTRAVIFDFDGTIADSFGYFAHFLAEKAKQSPLTDEQLSALKGLSLRPTAQQLGHAWWRMPGLYYAGRLWLGTVIHKVQPFEGVIDAIRQLHAAGYQLYVVSSNSPENITAFLEREGVRAEFTAIYGDIFWTGKRRVLRRILRQNHLRRSEVYYVGDETRDIKAARRAGIRSVAVTWGYNSRDTLAAERPNAMVDTAGQLQKALETAWKK